MSAPVGRGPWLQAGARVAVVAAAGVALVGGAARLGSPADDPQTPAVARGPATLTTAYCPGDPFVGADKGAPEVKVDGRVEAQAAPPEVLEGVVAASDEPGEITLDPVSAEPAPTGDEKPRSGPLARATEGLDEGAVRVRGAAERAPGLLAGQAFTASGARVQGLAATPCVAPTADAWLVAGGGERGRQERLVLTNPGGNAVTVQVEPVGSLAPGTADRSIVVPARGRSVVLLDAIGGTQAPQAVHVTATGGLVVPTIVDTHLDGLTPAGVEAVTPTMPPATRLVVPGSAPGGDRGMVLAAPGTSDAIVQIRRLGEGLARGAKVVTVPAGEVLDVDLSAVSGGDGWVVESDEPVVAAAHLTTSGASGRSDMAWSVATPAFGGLGGAVLPSAGTGVRRFAEVAATEGPARVDLLVLEDGEVSVRQIDLDADRSTALQVGRASAVWVRPTSGRVHAAAVLVGPDGASRAQATAVPILPARVSVRDVPVTRAP